MACFPHQAYWSGHYMTYELNVQAVCNSNCCFLYFGVVARGKCPDQKGVGNLWLMCCADGVNWLAD